MKHVYAVCTIRTVAGSDHSDRGRRATVEVNSTHQYEVFARKAYDRLRDVERRHTVAMVSWEPDYGLLCRDNTYDLETKSLLCLVNDLSESQRFAVVLCLAWVQAYATDERGALCMDVAVADKVVLLSDPE